jgi:hypothetical protein
LQKRLAEGKEITRKELNTIIKEYEKSEVSQLEAPEIISNTNFEIDSGAYKKDSTYWASVRPVPLTTDEVQGYQKSDSLAEISRKKDAGDTLKDSKHKGFQPWDVLIRRLPTRSRNTRTLRYTFQFPGFNTVDGWNFNYKVSFGTILQDTNKTRLSITPVFRYAFSREEPSGYLNFSMRNKKYRLQLQGGRFIKQYNPDEPILPIVNSFMTLFLEKNLMKIYERDYLDLTFRRKINPYFTIQYGLVMGQATRAFKYNRFQNHQRDDVEGYYSKQTRERRVV